MLQYTRLSFDLQNPVSMKGLFPTAFPILTAPLDKWQQAKHKFNEYSIHSCLKVVPTKFSSTKSRSWISLKNRLSWLFLTRRREVTEKYCRLLLEPVAGLGMQDHFLMLTWVVYCSACF